MQPRKRRSRRILQDGLSSARVRARSLSARLAPRQRSQARAASIVSLERRGPRHTAQRRTLATMYRANQRPVALPLAKGCRRICCPEYSPGRIAPRTRAPQRASTALSNAAGRAAAPASFRGRPSKEAEPPLGKHEGRPFPRSTYQTSALAIWPERGGALSRDSYRACAEPKLRAAARALETFLSRAAT